MQKEHWLALVAVHSDTWLISVAFYYGAELNKEGREKLFQLINKLPTCYEIVLKTMEDLRTLEIVSNKETPEDIFENFKARRQGILLALTQDVDELYYQCDPERDHLCLYGTSEGSWRVDLPAEEVPEELPEPALGINWARDQMQKEHWLALVAVYSDTWLISVVFFYGAVLNREGREKLFQLINELPTCYEIVSGKAKDVKKVKVKKLQLSESVPPPRAYPKRPEVMGPRDNRRFDEDDEEDAGEDGLI
eukprot:jgi/Botrbrau1/6528/Bobra.40_2s0001.1